MRNKAFTLIELVVAFTVMAVVLSAVMQSLQAFVTTSRKLSVVRETQKDLSFALLRMGDKIRNNPIDYDQYTSGDCAGTSKSSGTELCLNRGWGFKQELENLFITKDGKDSAMFPENIKVTKALFKISPDEDPEASTSWGKDSLQRQPRVDIELDIESLRDPDVQFSIQTSFSSRTY